MDRWLVIPIVPDELCVPSFQRTLQHLNAVHWAAPIASEGRRAVMPCCSAGAVLGGTSTSLSNGLRAARIMLERLVHLSIPQVRSSRLGQHSLTGQQQLRGKLNEFPRTQVFSSKVVPRSLKPSPKGWGPRCWPKPEIAVIWNAPRRHGGGSMASASSKLQRI